MQDSASQVGDDKRAARTARSTLHRRVYALMIGLVVWFVLSVWIFAGAGVTDYLLFVVSCFIFIVVVLLTILSRVGRNDSIAMTDDNRQSFRQWTSWDFDMAD
jgi:hypothetical protein